MSLPEVQLWQCLRGDALGVRIRRQRPIGPFVLDFYVTAARLAIEIDGAAHDVEEQAGRDVKRDAWLADQGIRVLRINARDVLNSQSRADVVATIIAAINTTR